MPMLPLDGGVELETAVDEARGGVCGVAVVAHPYGSLGGSMADATVIAVTNTLVRAGFRVVRFNSRGVGRSSGRASWTGEAEARDYQNVVLSAAAQFASDFPALQEARLVLAGYSAGAMYASAIDTASLPRNFARPIRLILISYPLDKLWALSMFGGSRWRQRVGDVCSNREVTTLLCQGDADQFTKAENYTSWLDGIKSRPDANVEAVTVRGADHFWSGHGTLSPRQALMQAIHKWLMGMDSQASSTLPPV
ncbi:unnamed protein product [Parajaminaea phylloscopi]